MSNRKVLMNIIFLLAARLHAVHSVGESDEQILKRVDDHINNFMNAPVRALTRAQRFLQVGGFPSIQVTDRDFMGKWLWMELFNTVYYGLEDGTFLLYRQGGAATDRPGLFHREPGNSGYPIDPVPEESERHWTSCVDEQGVPTNCTMPEGSAYVKCIDDCELKACDIPQNQCDQIEGPEERIACEKEIKWCEQYYIETVQPGENLGRVPAVYSCVNKIGAPEQTPGDVVIGGLREPELGNCYFLDEATLVNRTLEAAFGYCGEDGQCNPYIGAYRTRSYDPRYRPWYIESKDQQGPWWSDPYIFSTDLNVGITYTEPIYATEGQRNVFKGVFAVDYTLREIREFLLQFQGSQFLVAVVEAAEPNYVVATSTGSLAARSVRLTDLETPCQGEGDPAGCTVIRVKIGDLAENQDDILLRRAFSAQAAAGFPSSEIAPFKRSDELRDDAFFSVAKLFEQPNANLKWRILVVTPMQQSSSDAAYVGTPPFFIILTVSIVGFVFCFALLTTFFGLRNHRAIQNADWRFTCAFLLGCSMLNLSSLSLLGENRDGLCMLRMWLFNVCFAAALSPLFVKVWRMHRLLHASSRFRRVNVTNVQAMVRTLPIIFCEIVILTIFSIVDPAKAVENLGNEFGQVQSVTCQHESAAFFATQAAFHALLVIFGCYLAYETRNLDPRFGEAKQLAFAMYNTAFTGIVLGLISGLVTMDPVIQSLLVAMGVAWGAMFNSAAFVVPRLMEINQQREKLRRMRSVHSNKKFVLQGNHEVLVTNSTVDSVGNSGFDDSANNITDFLNGRKSSITPETDAELQDARGPWGKESSVEPEHRRVNKTSNPSTRSSSVVWADDQKLTVGIFDPETLKEIDDEESRSSEMESTDLADYEIPLHS